MPVRNLGPVSDILLTQEEVELLRQFRALEGEIHALDREWANLEQRGEGNSAKSKEIGKAWSQKQELRTRMYGSLARANAIINIWEQLFRTESVTPQDYFTFAETFIGSSRNKPLRLSSGRWLYGGYYYEVKGLYSDEQIGLLIRENFEREAGYYERLKRKYVAAEPTTSPERPRIPERVRIQVWRRDDGKCARCGSRENLEFDHIVPIVKGGSNTARNIELLCEKCNRSKGARVA